LIRLADLVKSIDIKIYIFFIVACLCVFPLFNDLGKRPIEMWDEARYANNAIDMYQHPNLFVVSYEGVPETYISKPPLVIWLEAISFKIFGLNEFALRFPSALMGLFTILILFSFCFSVLKNFTLGIISALILVSSKGFVSVHSTRTGDLDAALVFFTTLYSLYFLRYILLKQYTTKNIFIVALGIIMAFLTKGTAGFFLVPFLLIIAVSVNERKKIFTDKRWYYAASSVIIVVMGYLYVREILQPGFLKIFYKDEITRYSTEIYSWLVAPFNYYLMNIINERFTPYIFIFPFVLIIPLINKSLIIRRLWLFSLIIIIGYFLLISSSETKVKWYDLLIFPYLSLTVALLFHSVIDFIYVKFKAPINWKYKGILTATIICLVLVIPYNDIVASTNYAGDTESMYDMMKEGAYMRTLKIKYPQLSNYTVLKSVAVKPEHYDQIKFYQRTFNLTARFKIAISDSFDIKADKIILSCQKQFIEIIEKSKAYNVLDSCIGCKLYKHN